MSKTLHKVEKFPFSLLFPTAKNLLYLSMNIVLQILKLKIPTFSLKSVTSLLSGNSDWIHLLFKNLLSICQQVLR